MTKKILAAVLAALMLLSVCTACGDDSGVTNDSVIEIGTIKLSYNGENGDIFTYEYLTSTTVRITSISGNYEPHEIIIPATIQSGDVTLNVTEIGDGAFRACSYVSSIKTEAQLIKIGDFAFEDCESLVDLVLPDSITTIGRGAFYGCDNLKSIHLPTALETIGDCAFFDCISLETVTLPATVQEIGAGSFLGCLALNAFTMNEGLLVIGSQAFYNDTELKTVSIPASVQEIGDFAFATQLKDEEATINTVSGSYAETYFAELR